MKTALLWVAFVLSVLCLVSIAKAHPADDPCPPTQYVSFGCQLIMPHLGLTNPTMFALHKEYWHCRRNLEGTLREYAECLGAVNLRHAQRGLPTVTGEPICTDYHEVIPATPIVERPTDLKNAQNQIDACKLNICHLHVGACWAYLGSIW